VCGQQRATWRVTATVAVLFFIFLWKMDRTDTVVCCDLLGYYVPFTEMLEMSVAPSTSIRRLVTYCRYFEYQERDGSKERPYDLAAQFSMEYFVVGIRFLVNQENIICAVQTCVSKANDTKSYMRRFDRMMPGYHYLKYFKDLSDLTAFCNWIKRDPWSYHYELKREIQDSLAVGHRRRVKKALFIMWVVKCGFANIYAGQHSEIGEKICWMLFDYKQFDYRV